MRLLLDTHTFLWHQTGNPRMSAASTALLIDPGNDLFLSMGSAWEIAIKVGLKKLTLSDPYSIFMSRALTAYGIMLMPITLDDCADYEQLPCPDPRHRDPFDRMIVTHAIRNQLAIVSADPAFDAYGMQRIW